MAWVSAVAQVVGNVISGSVANNATLAAADLADTGALAQYQNTADQIAIQRAANTRRSTFLGTQYTTQRDQAKRARDMLGLDASGNITGGRAGYLRDAYAATGNQYTRKKAANARVGVALGRQELALGRKEAALGRMTQEADLSWNQARDKISAWGSNYKASTVAAGLQMAGSAQAVMDKQMNDQTAVNELTHNNALANIGDARADIRDSRATISDQRLDLKDQADTLEEEYKLAGSKYELDIADLRNEYTTATENLSLLEANYNNGLADIADSDSLLTLQETAAQTLRDNTIAANQATRESTTTWQFARFFNPNATNARVNGIAQDTGFQIFNALFNPIQGISG
jgi:hypothetical protein